MENKKCNNCGKIFPELTGICDNCGSVSFTPIVGTEEIKETKPMEVEEKVEEILENEEQVTEDSEPEEKIEEEKNE